MNIAIEVVRVQEYKKTKKAPWWMFWTDEIVVGHHYMITATLEDVKSQLITGEIVSIPTNTPSGRVYSLRCTVLSEENTTKLKSSTLPADDRRIHFYPSLTRVFEQNPHQ